MNAKQKNIRLKKVDTEVEILKSELKTTFKYKIILDDNLNPDDNAFLMNIIDLCAVKQTLSKQLEFVKCE
jgi:hypothetical protein